MPTELPIPDEVRAEVYRRVYREAADVRWQHASAEDKSRQYAAWATEPTVGGVLERYMDAERVRSWLKDVPMKEFSRALAGIGPYARFVDRHGPTPVAVVTTALGHDANVIEDTIGIKPLHCSARRQNQTVFVTWGPVKDFKHLLWAALRELEQPTSPVEAAVVALMTSAAEVVPETQRRLYDAVAGRCGVEISYMPGQESSADSAQSTALGQTAG
jgi:hypothetical protein